MWRTRNKKSQAVKQWHTAAMLVDPKKTTITLILKDEVEIEEANETIEETEAMAPLREIDFQITGGI